MTIWKDMPPEQFEKLRADYDKLLAGFAYLKDESAKEIERLRTQNAELLAVLKSLYELVSQTGLQHTRSGAMPMKRAGDIIAKVRE